MCVPGEIWPFFFELTHLTLKSHATQQFIKNLRSKKRILIFFTGYIFFQRMIHIIFFWAKLLFKKGQLWPWPGKLGFISATSANTVSSVTSLSSGDLCDPSATNHTHTHTPHTYPIQSMLCILLWFYQTLSSLAFCLGSDSERIWTSWSESCPPPAPSRRLPTWRRRPRRPPRRRSRREPSPRPARCALAVNCGDWGDYHSQVVFLMNIVE